MLKQYVPGNSIYCYFKKRAEYKQHRIVVHYSLPVEKNHVLFLRNNVIVESIQSITTCPYIYNDDDDTEMNILENNKEVAMFYACLILCCLAYIVISDMFQSSDDDIYDENI